MKKNFGIILAIAISLSALLLSVAFQAGWVKAIPSRQESSHAPTIVSYQGRVWNNDTPFSGNGYFKFAILNHDGSIQYWSNHTLTSPPTESVMLTVSNGFFSINLGDTSISGMSMPLTASVFENPDTRLRVWFSPDASTWTQMPDQVIASVPYSLQAQQASFADNADKLDNKDGGEYQLRVSAICPENYAFKEIDASGDGVCVPVEHRPPYSLTVISDEDLGWDSSIVIGVDGLPLISFYDDYNDSLMVMHCLTLDCSFYDIFTIDDSAPMMGIWTALAIGQDGYGLIAYVDGTNNDLKVAHCDDLECSNASIKSTLFSGGNLAGLSITLGVDGYAVISFSDTSSGELFVAYCTDPNCVTAQVNKLYSCPLIGPDTSITIATDGLPLVFFYDANLGDLRAAHCVDVACASTITTTALDTVGNIGDFNAITLGVDGLGLISYYDSLNKALKVAHCDDTACSSASVYVLDNPTNYVGIYTDITIGSDGLGVISYQDHGSQTLKVAHCNNIDCSSATLYTVDNNKDTGGSSSITIGTDGMPIISYYDWTLQSLKVMHCSNVFCLPYTRSH